MPITLDEALRDGESILALCEEFRIAVDFLARTKTVKSQREFIFKKMREYLKEMAGYVSKYENHSDFSEKKLKALEKNAREELHPKTYKTIFRG